MKTSRLFSYLNCSLVLVICWRSYFPSDIPPSSLGHCPCRLCLHTTNTPTTTSNVLLSGHFAAAFVTHAFCNLLGLPDVPELLQLPLRQRCLHFGLHVLGIVLWCLALPALTASCRYDTRIHYLQDL